MKRLIVLTIAAAALLAADLRQPPAEQWSARLAVASIHAYRATLGRWYAHIGLQCRFTPTCSLYGEACLLRFGAARGGWLALTRILRCGPWTPRGTVDPPPPA